MVIYFQFLSLIDFFLQGLLIERNTEWTFGGDGAECCIGCDISLRTTECIVSLGDGSSTKTVEKTTSNGY